MVPLVLALGSGGPVVRLGQVCVVGSVLAPAVGALTVAWRRTRASGGARIATVLSGAAAVCAGGSWAAVAVHGPVAVEVARTGRGPWIGLSADHLTVTLLTLICSVGALVQSYSVRYLRADERSWRFFVGSSVLVASMAFVATSSTAPGVVAGWMSAGWAFVTLVGYRPDLPGVAAAVRRTRTLLLVGDAALFSALVLLCMRAGNLDIAVRGGATPASLRLGGAGIPIAMLLVLAALTRCAQGPLGRWLPTTIAAPTPVSALLHAGFVNGGAILLVRFGMLSTDSLLAMVIAFALSTATAVVASAVMSRRPDVKGALAFSTMGQMGFMIAECTVGAAGAAMVHLVGHAIYKATLFLGSGRLAHRDGLRRSARTQRITLARLTVSGAAGGAAAGVLAVVPGTLEHRGGTVLLVFVATTAGLAAWHGWIDGRPALVAGWTSALLMASGIYGLAAGGLAAWLQPALPAVGSGALSPWLLLVVVGCALALALFGRTSRFGRQTQMLLVHAGAPTHESGVRIASGSHAIGRTPAVRHLEASGSAA